MADKIEVFDKYYGFWPDHYREIACRKLREVVWANDIKSDSGADAAIEQLWNTLIELSNGDGDAR